MWLLGPRTPFMETTAFQQFLAELSQIYRRVSTLKPLHLSLGLVACVLATLTFTWCAWRLRVSHYNELWGTGRSVHLWSSFKTSGQPLYCSACRQLICGFWIFRNTGWECTICGRTAHRRCLTACESFDCKCPSQPEPLRHQLVQGNLPTDSVCCVCGIICSSPFGLHGLRCLWCGRTIHEDCVESLPESCDMGPFSRLILPPTLVRLAMNTTGSAISPLRLFFSKSPDALATVAAKATTNTLPLDALTDFSLHAQKYIGDRCAQLREGLNNVHVAMTAGISSGLKETSEDISKIQDALRLCPGKLRRFQELPAPSQDADVLTSTHRNDIRKPTSASPPGAQSPLQVHRFGVENRVQCFKKEQSVDPNISTLKGSRMPVLDVMTRFSEHDGRRVSHLHAASGPPDSRSSPRRSLSPQDRELYLQLLLNNAKPGSLAQPTDHKLQLQAPLQAPVFGIGETDQIRKVLRHSLYPSQRRRRRHRFRHTHNHEENDRPPPSPIHLEAVSSSSLNYHHPCYSNTPALHLSQRHAMTRRRPAAVSLQTLKSAWFSRSSRANWTTSSASYRLKRDRHAILSNTGTHLVGRVYRGPASVSNSYPEKHQRLKKGTHTLPLVSKLRKQDSVASPTLASPTPLLSHNCDYAPQSSPFSDRMYALACVMSVKADVWEINFHPLTSLMTPISGTTTEHPLPSQARSTIERALPQPHVSNTAKDVCFRRHTLARRPSRRTPAVLETSGACSAEDQQLWELLPRRNSSTDGYSDSDDSKIPCSGAATGAEARALFSITKPSPLLENRRPLLVFVNTKSGGQMGNQLLKELYKYLNPMQVVDIQMDGGPQRALHRFKCLADANRLRILVCGGDGTAGWVIDELQKIYGPPSQAHVPVGILPLGTGNDLARVLGWGTDYDGDLPRYLTKVDSAQTRLLDLWRIRITAMRIKTTSSSKRIGAGRRLGFSHHRLHKDRDGEPDGSADTSPPLILETTFNNYMDIGVAARIALKFHQLREAHPELFQSRLANKFLYGEMGVREWVAEKTHHLGNIRLWCDGLPVILPEKQIEGLIVVNIPSFSGGVDLWAADDDDDAFSLSDATPAQGMRLQRQPSTMHSVVSTPHHQQIYERRTERTSGRLVSFFPYQKRRQNKCSGRLSPLGHSLLSHGRRLFRTSPSVSSSPVCSVQPCQAASRSVALNLDTAHSTASTTNFESQPNHPKQLLPTSLRCPSTGSHEATFLSDPTSPCLKTHNVSSFEQLLLQKEPTVNSKPVIADSLPTSSSIQPGPRTPVERSPLPVPCFAMKTTSTSLPEATTTRVLSSLGPAVSSPVLWQPSPAFHQETSSPTKRSFSPRFKPCYPRPPRHSELRPREGSRLGALLNARSRSASPSPTYSLIGDEELRSDPTHSPFLKRQPSGKDAIGSTLYSRWQKQSIRDEVIEVVAVRSLFHLGQIQVGLAEPIRVCQGRSIRIDVPMDVPLQINGEPRLVPPCTIDITFKNESFVLSPAQSQNNDLMDTLREVLDSAVVSNAITSAQRSYLLRELTRHL